MDPFLPAFLDRAIRKCTERNPEKRFASVEEVAAALEPKLPRRVQEGEAPLVEPESHLREWSLADSIMVVAALAGVFLLSRFSLYSFPAAHARVVLDPAEAARDAGKLLGQGGWEPGKTGRVSVASRSEASIAVPKTFPSPADELQRIVSEHSRLVWQVPVKPKDLDDHLTVKIYSDGTPAGIDNPKAAADSRVVEQVKALAHNTSRPPEELRELARKFASEALGVDLARLRLDEEVERKNPFLNVATRQFSWSAPEEDALGRREKLSVEFLGSRVWSPSHTHETLKPDVTPVNYSSPRPLLRVVFVMAYGLLALFLVVVGRTWKRFTWPMLAGFFVLSLLLLMGVLAQPGAITGPVGFIIAFSLFLFGPILTLGLVLMLLVGLQALESRWPAKAAAALRLGRPQGWRDPAVLMGALRGGALALAALGIYSLARFLLMKFARVPFAPTYSVDSELGTHVPFVFILVGGYVGALAMALYVVTPVAFLRRFTLRRMSLVVCGSAFWLAVNNQVIGAGTTPRMWFELLADGVVLAAALVAFFRYDFLTLLTFCFSFYALRDNFMAWMLTRETGNAQFTFLFALWLAALAFCAWSLGRRRITGALRRASATFEK